MLMCHIQYKKPIVLGGGQRSFGVNMVKLLKPCKHDISRREAWKYLTFLIYVYHMEYKIVLLLMEFKGHLGSTGTKL